MSLPRYATVYSRVAIVRSAFALLIRFHRERKKRGKVEKEGSKERERERERITSSRREYLRPGAPASAVYLNARPVVANGEGSLETSRVEAG